MSASPQEPLDSDPRSRWNDASDAELIDAIAAGDRSAFEYVYDEHSGKVHSLCFRILRRDADAEDAVLDVFEDLWRRPQRYDPSRGSLLTWLFVLARSRSLDRARSIASERRIAESIVESKPGAATPGEATGEMAGALEGLGALAHRHEVLAAYSRLDPKCREAVRLCIVEGLTMQQAASALHEPVGTIKSRIRNSLIRMRGVLRIPDGSESP